MHRTHVQELQVCRRCNKRSDEERKKNKSKSATHADNRKTGLRIVFLNVLFSIFLFLRFFLSFLLASSFAEELCFIRGAFSAVASIYSLNESLCSYGCRFFPRYDGEDEGLYSSFRFLFRDTSFILSLT